MNDIEIERKYLLDTLPDDLEKHPNKSISQGYITTDSHNEVRIRSKGDDCFLTVKQGSGLCRTEVEIVISENQFNALWKLTANKRVEKIRYDYQGLSSLLEIDVYSNELAPLKVVEIEFNSVDESHHFTPPAFFGREVTDDKAYKNASLAIHGIPDSYAEDLHE